MFEKLISLLDKNKEWLLSGLGIATFGILVKVIAHFTKNKGKRKIKITTTFSQTWVQTVFGQGPVFPMYSFEITNIGDTDIIIKDVLLYFCGKKIDTKFGKTNTLTEVGINNNLLSVLKPGELRKGSFEITSIQNSITNEIKENKKIRLLGIDAYGNKYFSKKSRYGSFNNNVITSNMINSKRH